MASGSVALDTIEGMSPLLLAAAGGSTREGKRVGGSGKAPPGGALPAGSGGLLPAQHLHLFLRGQLRHLGHAIDGRHAGVYKYLGGCGEGGHQAGPRLAGQPGVWGAAALLLQHLQVQLLLIDAGHLAAQPEPHQSGLGRGQVGRGTRATVAPPCGWCGGRLSVPPRGRLPSS